MGQKKGKLTGCVDCELSQRAVSKSVGKNAKQARVWGWYESGKPLVARVSEDIFWCLCN